MSKYEDIDIKKFPYLGYSPNLIEYFLIIGYDSSFIQKDILPGIDTQVKEQSDKSFDSQSTSDAKVFSEYKIKQYPTVLSSISSNYNKEMLDNDMIIHLSFPDPPKIYYNAQDNNKYDPNAFSVVFFLNGDALDTQTKVPFHGYTFIFYEPMETPAKKKAYVPRAFSMVSQYPFFCLFHNLSCEILKQFKSELPIPLEILLYNILNFTPSPINYPLLLNFFPNLDLQIYVKTAKNGMKDDNILRQTLMNQSGDDLNSTNYGPKPGKPNQPKQILNQLTGYPVFDFNVSEIFNILPIPTIVEVLIFNLLECEMLFFSKNIEVLNLVMYIISSLSYPCNDSIYLWHILSVAKNEIVKFSGNSKFVGKPFASMLGVNCTYTTDINTVKIYGTHFIVDLDNKKIHLKKNEEEEYDDEDGEVSDLQKIKDLRAYIKKIIEDKKVKSSFLEKIIKDLINELQVISKKVIHAQNNHISPLIPRFFFTENNNTTLNKSIQEAFYNFVLNILHKYSSFYSLSSMKENNDTSNVSNVTPNSNESIRANLSQNSATDIEHTNDQLNQSTPVEHLNSSNNVVNVSNSKSHKSDLDEDNEINMEDIKKNKPYYLKYHKVTEHFAKEERYFCSLFRNSVKFSNYVSDFLKNYKCIDLYKIPLIFSEEFIGLKNIDPKEFNSHFFDIMDKFFNKDTFEKKGLYESIVNDAFFNPQEMNARPVNFNMFYAHYNESNLKTYIYEEAQNSQVIKTVVTRAFYTKKYSYKYKSIELDNNIILKYIYYLTNLPKDKLEEIFPTIEMQRGNELRHVNQRDIANSIERTLIGFKTITTKELIVFSILYTICMCTDYIENEMSIANIFEMISKEKYCLRKYLSMILATFYNNADKKIKENPTAITDLEFTWFNKTISFLQKKKILPDEQMMKAIELFAVLKQKRSDDNNEDSDLQMVINEVKPKEEEFNTFLNRTFCKDGTRGIDYFLKLSENSEYEGNLRVDCERCGKTIEPKIVIQFLKKELVVDFYSPRKIYNESGRLCNDFLKEMKRENVDLDVLKVIVINLIFYVDKMGKLEKSISQLLYTFLKKLLEKK